MMPMKFSTLAGESPSLYGAPSFHKRIESATNSVENHSPYYSDAELRRKRGLRNSNSLGSLRERNSLEVFLPELKKEVDH